ncbi:MAG: cation-translocating P-type ATPase, partial [Methylococcales bacterium]|nr:cation-translocating P-type ATPase [Methylococcales bacterium]
KKINIDSLLENKAEKYQEQGYSSLFLAVNENIVALFVLFDPLKSDAKSTINTLKKMGFNISLLSGDRYSTVQSVAIQLGGLEAFAEVLPQQKYQIIQQFQQSQKTVIMVGDGINDAPALIMADIGIAIGSGTDISIESADIVLTHDKLEQIIQSIELSRQCLRTIHQNIIISILYNIIMVPLAMMAFVTPLVAAITMPISSLLVIMNASRLRIKKGKN